MFGSKESTNENQENKKTPILDFDGKKYDINALPDEVKEILKGLQVADTQIRMHKDTLKLLDLGRNSLGAKLKEQLESITPLEN
tara:strand:+ start:763 stop:1014 length:252 start_codon:yes stop_codon:yes gene_type:complete